MVWRRQQAACAAGGVSDNAARRNVAKRFAFRQFFIALLLLLVVATLVTMQRMWCTSSDRYSCTRRLSTHRRLGAADPPVTGNAVPPPTIFEPPPSHAAPPVVRLAVASGASPFLFAPLQNLVGSVHFWCPDCDIALFSLGLLPAQQSQLQGVCRTRLFWGGVDDDAGVDSRILAARSSPHTSAYKPFAIAEALENYPLVLWIDAGDTVVGPLDRVVLPLLVSDGHLLTYGQDADMLQLTHPDTITHLAAKATEALAMRATCGDETHGERFVAAAGREELSGKDVALRVPRPASFFAGKRSYSSATVGFAVGSRAVTALLLPWLECAGNASCIAPTGATRANHAYDQSALNVIIYSQAGDEWTPHTEVLAGQRSQLGGRATCEDAATMDLVVWSSRSEERCHAGHVRRCEVGNLDGEEVTS